MSQKTALTLDIVINEEIDLRKLRILWKVFCGLKFLAFTFLKFIYVGKL